MLNSRSRLAAALERLWYTHSPFAFLLWPFSAVISIAASLRRWLFLEGFLSSVGVNAKVVVVGNLSVGGTGKTPITVWLARELQDRGYRVAIVCSGYGGQAARGPAIASSDSDPLLVGDEAVLLARQTACAIAVGRNRAAAAIRLIELGRPDVILSDDGLQHYRLRRDVELAVIDGTRGLGNGMCLPAGPLREPQRRLESVDAVIVNDGAWGSPGMLRCSTMPTGARNLGSAAPVSTLWRQSVIRNDSSQRSSAAASRSSAIRCRITRRFCRNR